MKKLNASNFRKDTLYPRVVNAVSSLLSKGDEISPVEVLKMMGNLQPKNEQAWRKGQVPCLERVIEGSLGKCSRVLRILHLHCISSGMTEKIHAYKIKGGAKPLRFSLSGDANLEQSYMRHYHLNRKQKQESAAPSGPASIAATEATTPPTAPQRVALVKAKRLGGCLCGDVRYEVRGKPLGCVVCHCRSCQKAVGAPMVAWVDYALDQFSWTTAPAKVFRSSPELERSFCDRCGTALTNQRAENAKEISVTLSSLDVPQDLHPDVHIWTGSKLPWVELGTNIPAKP